MGEVHAAMEMRVRVHHLQKIGNIFEEKLRGTSEGEMDKLTHDLLLLKDLRKWGISSGHPPGYILYITHGLEEKNNEQMACLLQQCIREAPAWHTDAHPVLYPENTGQQQ